MHLSVDMLGEDAHAPLRVPVNTTYPAPRPELPLEHGLVQPRPTMLPASAPQAQTVFGAAYELGVPLGSAGAQCPVEPAAVLAMSQRLLREGMGCELRDVVYGALLFPRALPDCCSDLPLDCQQLQLVMVTMLGLDCDVRLQQLAGSAGADFLDRRMGSARRAAQLFGGAGGGADGGAVAARLTQLAGVDPSAPPATQLRQAVATGTDGVATLLQAFALLGMPEMSSATLANFCPANCQRGNAANPRAYTPCQLAAALMKNVNAPLRAVSRVLRLGGFLAAARDDSAAVLGCATTPQGLLATLAPLSSALSSCLSYTLTCAAPLRRVLPAGATPEALLKLLGGLNSTAAQVDAAGLSAATLAEVCPATCGTCRNASDVFTSNTRDAAAGPSLLTVLYNSSFTHAAPVYLALGDSGLRSLRPGGGGAISVRSHPLPWTFWEKNGSVYSVIIGLIQSLTVCLFVLIAFSFVPGTCPARPKPARTHAIACPLPPSRNGAPLCPPPRPTCRVPPFLLYTRLCARRGDRGVHRARARAQPQRQAPAVRALLAENDAKNDATRRLSVCTALALQRMGPAAPSVHLGLSKPAPRPSPMVALRRAL